MNVYSVVFLLIVIISATSYFFGKSLGRLSTAWAIFVIFFTSIFIGFVVTYGLMSAVIVICQLLSLSGTQCVNTDQNTVWLLLAPILPFPIYMVFMFSGRLKSKFLSGQNEKNDLSFSEAKHK